MQLATQQGVVEAFIFTDSTNNDESKEDSFKT